MSRPCDGHLKYNRPTHVSDKVEFLTDSTIPLTITNKTKSGGLAGTNATGLSNWYLLFTYYLIVGGEH